SSVVLRFFHDQPTTGRYPLSYTTLFRSIRDPAPRAPRQARVGCPRHSCGDRRMRAQAESPADTTEQRHSRVLTALALAAARLLQDRKSTRLNSSHVKISYAVFCLKKKNY